MSRPTVLLRASKSDSFLKGEHKCIALKLSGFSSGTMIVFKLIVAADVFGRLNYFVHCE